MDTPGKRDFPSRRSCPPLQVWSLVSCLGFKLLGGQTRQLNED